MNIDLVFIFYQLLHIVIIISQRISPSYAKKKCTSAATMHLITLTISLQRCIKLSNCHRLLKAFRKICEGRLSFKEARSN